MPKRLTQKEFIDKSREKHGDKFDYSEAKYTTAHAPIIIKCLTHNTQFTQSAEGHMKGKNGCPDCNGQTPIDREEFIKRAIDGHGEGKFDYSQVDESVKGNIHGKVKITCLKHNVVFEQSAWVHLRPANGCPKCSTTKKKTLEDIIETSAEKLPGLNYDYSNVNLQARTTEKVVIGCYKQEHGTFEQSLSNHWAGKTGCRGCQQDKRAAKKAQKG